jgi:adenosylcobyric acid synthase
VLGICGGCQMLGRTIVDEHGVESQTSVVSGLDLLPVDTRFLPDKRTRRVRVRRARPSFLTSGLAREATYEGYFIHAGRLELDAPPLFHVEEDESACEDGAVSESGDVVGTMVHGLFENDGVRHALLDTLRKRKGLAATQAKARTNRGAAFDELARVLAETCDMAQIERIALG